MRRVIGMIVALSLCVSLLTPMAIAMLVTPHACCVRNMRSDAPAGSMSHEHCARSAHRPPSSASLSPLAQGPCHRCCSCLGPVISMRQQARPDTSFFTPAPAASHPFLNEFYPSEDSSSEFHQDAGRAPPSSDPLR